MHEFLGIVLGVAIGSGLRLKGPRRKPAAALLCSALVAGLLTSAVNGELHAPFWPVFVTLDTLLAVLGCALGVLLASRPGARAEV